MRALSLLLVLFTVSFQIIGQSVNQSNQYFYKLNSSYVFCDNSPRNWCTLELETDTIIPIENNIYFCFNKSAQFTGVPFEFKNSSSPPDPFKAEEYALKAHKKWELDYQKTTFKNRLKDGEVLFLNNKGKQFLIWWFESPKKSKTPERSIEIKTKPYSNFLDSTGIEYDVTHQLFLDFIVHGSTCYSMSIPVLESETLQDEIIRLQKIANTLKIYGSFIDLNILYKRINNKNSFVFTDSKNLIEIELPDWLNIVQSPFDNAIAGSFPEVDNILNAVAITWIYKTDSLTFEDFIKQRKGKEQRENVQVIFENENFRREFYKKENSKYTCQNIYLAGDNVFCFIVFTATPTTYYVNLPKLNELIEKIILK